MSDQSVLTSDKRAEMRQKWRSSDIATVLKHWAKVSGKKELFCFHTSPPSLERGLVGQDLQRRTYEELDGNARKIAGWLQVQKSAQQSRVLLVFPAGLEFIDALMGCFYARFIAVPTTPPSAKKNRASASRFSAVVRDCQPAIILTTPALRDLVASWVADISFGTSHYSPLVETLESITRQDLGFCDPQSTSGDAISLIQYTSGSTGDPKGVTLTQRNILANLEGIADKFLTTEQSKGFFWLPPHHDMGLIGAILETIYMGGFTGLMDPSLFVANPLSWLEGITLHRASISGAPNFAFELCSSKAANQSIDHLDLGQWRVVFSGAEPVQARTISVFSKTFATRGLNEKNWMPCYGLAESTLMVTCTESEMGPTANRFSRKGIEDGALQPTRDTDPSSVTLVSNGSIIAEHSLRIIDPGTGEELEAGMIGEIQIAGPSVSGGYWLSAERSEEKPNQRAIQGDAGRAGPDFLSTGDLGAILGPHLYVTGRLEDLLIVRGRNLHPTDLEGVAEQSSPEIQAHSCAAFSAPRMTGTEEDIILACEIRRETRRDLDKLATTAKVRESLMLSHQVNPDQVILLRPGTLPRTTSGKIRRKACREAFLQKAWSPIHIDAAHCQINSHKNHLFLDGSTPRRLLSLIQNGGVTQIELDDRLALINEYLEDCLLSFFPKAADQVHLSSRSLASLGLDSMSQIQLAVDLETNLGISLGKKPVEPTTTIVELAHQINDLLEETEDSAESEGSAQEFSSGDTVPMSPIQREYLSGDIQNAGGFTVTTHLRILAGTNRERLAIALRETFNRHDAFALRFELQNGVWCQTYRPELPRFEFETHEIVSADRDEWKKLAIELESRSAQEFNLETGPLVRAVFLDRGRNTRGMLSVTAHHLVVDAISMRILIRQVEATYLSLMRGSQGRMKFPACRYLRWAESQAEQAKTAVVTDQLPFWRQQLAPLAKETNNPNENHDSPENSAVASITEPRISISRTIDQLTSEQILTNFNTSRRLHDAILAALIRSAASLLNKDELVVRLRHHGRFTDRERNTASVVGWLTHHFPVAFGVRAKASLPEIVADVSTKLGLVPDAGTAFGWLCQSGAGHNMARLLNNEKPLDIFFSFLEDVRFGANATEQFRVLETLVRHNYTNESFYPESLVVHGEIRNARIQITMTADRHLFCEEAIDNLAMNMFDDLAYMTQDSVNK